MLTIRVKPSAFNSVYYPHLKNDHRYQIYYGGSSSGKSFFLATRAVLDCLQGRNYLVVRKVAKTLRGSCWNEIQKAITRHNLNNQFRIRQSDMIIEAKASGAQIVFAGLDDVEKIKSITPAKGKMMYLANTTGTSSTDRVEGMVKNAIAGIIAAKACGVKRPTVGILNIDGARQAEGILKQLKENGYDITFAESARADGGCVMRGNDVLLGSCDVMVMDSLTGNVLSKMLSAFHSGGSYEAVGYGYGPGIGEGYDKLVMIVSRASGAKVLQGAIEYAAELIRGDYLAVAKAEFEAANKAGLKELLAQKKAPKAQEASAQAVTAPPKEVVTAQVAGIEIMDLDDAVQTLWKAGIYAESGMGCTGPIVLMSEANHDKAVEELKKAGYIQ